MNKLLPNLKYILPMRRRVLDTRLKTAIKIMDGLYGEKISSIMQGFDWLAPNGQIRPDCNDIAINTITECMRTAQTSGVHVVNGKLKIQKINYGDTKIAKPVKYDNDCAIGYVFLSLLILFDKVLQQVSNIPDNDFNYRVAVLISNLQAVQQAENFMLALEKRQAHRNVALSSAKKKNEIRERVNTILRTHCIRMSDTNKEMLPRIKTWYKQEYNQPYPYKDKKLEEHLLDYCNSL